MPGRLKLEEDDTFTKTPTCTFQQQKCEITSLVQRSPQSIVGGWQIGGIFKRIKLA